jgi:hypothetical protein
MSASRWACGQRTATESAVARGLITREAAMKLLTKYGVPMTAMSRVYRGERPAEPEQGKLV